jgi:hypothetical protein
MSTKTASVSSLRNVVTRSFALRTTTTRPRRRGKAFLSAARALSRCAKATTWGAGVDTADG